MTVSERLRASDCANVASSEIASEASLRNYIDRPLSEQLRACSGVLSDELSGEGHVSHCNRVLRLCHPEQSSCSGEFGCLSFVKLALRSLFTICLKNQGKLKSLLRK